MNRRLVAALVATGLALVAKDSKAPAKPTAGVKTPGVLIPMDRLKADAEVALGSAPAGLHFAGDTIVVAESAGAVRRLDGKTNKPFEPSRDVSGVEKPCGGLAAGFASLFTVACGPTPQLAKIDQPEPRGGGRRGPRGGGPPAGVKPEAAKVETPKSEAAAKPEPPKPEGAKLPRPEPFNPKPTVLTPLDAAPAARAALAVTEDSLWLLADAKTSLQRLDPQTSAIVAEVRLPAACAAILAAEGAIWVACPNEARLLRIDPRTNLVDKRIEVPAEPIALAAGEGSIWVLCRKEGKVARIDPKTNKQTAAIELAVPGVEGTLAFGEGNLWASLPGFPVMRIAPASDKVAQQFHGPGGGVIAFGAGSLWVSSPSAKTLVRLDPKRVVATLSE